MEQKLREVQKNELDLVKFLLDQSEFELKDYILSKFVFDDQDKGTGFRFFYNNFDYSGCLNAISDYQYNDSDGIPIIITLYENGGYILEVDIWKVNFTPILSWPNM